MQEEVDQLQYKMYWNCDGRSTWPAPKEEVIDQLQWNKIMIVYQVVVIENIFHQLW